MLTCDDDINNIINERELNGKFTDFNDLVKRLDSKDTNKRVIESLQRQCFKRPIYTG